MKSVCFRVFICCTGTYLAQPKIRSTGAVTICKYFNIWHVHNTGFVILEILDSLTPLHKNMVECYCERVNAFFEKNPPNSYGEAMQNIYLISHFYSTDPPKKDTATRIPN